MKTALRKLQDDIVVMQEAEYRMSLQRISGPTGEQVFTREAVYAEKKLELLSIIGLRLNRYFGEEKEQIINGFISGYRSNFSANTIEYDANNYYNNTFERSDPLSRVG